MTEKEQALNAQYHSSKNRTLVLQQQKNPQLDECSLSYTQYYYTLNHILFSMKSSRYNYDVFTSYTRSYAGADKSVVWSFYILEYNNKPGG
jgi:hypothetical protein